MSSIHRSRSIPPFAARALPAALCLALAACGGGGGDSDGATAAANDAAAAVDQRLNALAAQPALPPAPAGLAGNVTCVNQTLGAIALDSVFVPANAACRMEGTRLVGNVTVGAGASLDAVGIAANGSLQAEGAAHVALTGPSSIGGSVQVMRGDSVRVEGARITGDLQVDALRGAVTLLTNRVGGSLQAVGNRGGVLIESNTMDGNLQCSENLPAPVATGNRAASFDGQCATGAGPAVPGTGGGSSGGSGGGTVPAPGPLSGNVTCNGLRLGAVALDTVIVPAGAACVLEGTSMIGSLLVGQGASVSATGVRVNGNLQAEGAAMTSLGGASRIGGSVQIKDGQSASLTGATIAGDLQIESMSGPVSASGNRLGGNLQATGNRGGVALLSNRMEGALQCTGNLPAPTGSGNVASVRQEQCRNL